MFCESSTKYDTVLTQNATEDQNKFFGTSVREMDVVFSGYVPLCLSVLKLVALLCSFSVTTDLKGA